MTEVSLAAERVEMDSVEEDQMAGPFRQGEDMGDGGKNGWHQDQAEKAGADKGLDQAQERHT